MPKISAESSVTWKQHQERWKSCKECSLCETRKNVALLKGQIPCDVLFVGDAPGASEDVVGRPFVGPAGKLLDEIVRDAGVDRCSVCNLPQYETPSGIVCDNGHGGAPVKKLRIAYTYLVACLSQDSEGKIVEPTKESIHACRDRLTECVNLCKPRLVVCVGKLVSKSICGQNDFGRCDWLRGGSMNFVEIVHPAAILQADISRRGLLAQRAVVTLSDAFSELK